MDWDDLRIFLHIARTGRIIDAAKNLSIDHSTASRRLARLEQQVGAKLFDRAGRRLKITAAGETLAEVASRMESLVIKDIGSLTSDTEEAKGKVRIGAPEGLGIAYLASRLPRMAAAHPKLEIELVALPQNYSLASREVDIAITLDRPEVGDVSTRKLTDYQLGFFATESYFHRHGNPPALEGLADADLCGYITELLPTKELDYLGLAVRSVPKIRSTSIIAQREMIASGHLIGVLPFFMADGAEVLIPVLNDAFVLNRSYWLSVHNDLRGLSRVRAVISAVVQAVKRDKAIFSPKLDREINARSAQQQRGPSSPHS
jgi:DNA-binding transcriptional LysR family regulator